MTSSEREREREVCYLGETVDQKKYQEISKKKENLWVVTDNLIDIGPKECFEVRKTFR